MRTFSRGQQIVVLVLILGMTLLYYYSIHIPDNQSQKRPLMLGQAQDERDDDTLVLGRSQSQRPQDAATKNMSGAQLLTLNKKININSSTKTDLEAIRGIGPRTAEKIVEYRQSHGRFKRVEDIKNVRGISGKKFNKIKMYITAE